MMLQKTEMLDLRNKLVAGFSMRSGTCKTQLVKKKIVPVDKDHWQPIELKELNLQTTSEPFTLLTGMPLPAGSGTKIKNIQFQILKSLKNEQYLGELIVTPDGAATNYGPATVRVPQIVTAKSGLITSCLATQIPSCLPGQVYQGFDPSGNAVCLPIKKLLATSGLNCGAGKLMQGFDKKGALICVDLSARAVAAARSIAPLTVTSTFKEATGRYDLIFHGPPKASMTGTTCAATSGACGQPYVFGPLDENGDFKDLDVLDNVSCELLKAGRPCTITYHFVETTNNSKAKVNLIWK